MQQAENTRILKNGYLRNSDSKVKYPLRDVENAPELFSTVIPGLFSGFDQFRLNPARLADIVSSADNGDPREQSALFSAMQEKEPIIYAHLQTRRMAVLSCDWEVRSTKHPDVATAITRELVRAGLHRAMAHLLDAIGTGYSGVTVDWLPGGRGVRGFVPIMPESWVFDEGGYPAITPAVGAAEIPLSAYHPAQVIYIQGEGKVGLPCRKGLMRTLLWLYLYKNAAFRDWNTFLERFGIPFVMGKIPSSEFGNVAKRKELVKSLQEIRSAGVGVGTTETEMQFLNGASGSNQQAYENHQRYCDEVIAVTILGQLASSDHSGGLSKGSAQERVRYDILQADAAMLSEKINSNLVYYMAELEYGLPGEDFDFIIDCDVPEDMNLSADRDAKIAAATGCRLSREYAEEKYGIKLEEPDAVIPMQPSVPEMKQEFSDTPKRRKEDAADKIVRAALSRMVDNDAFAAWRIPISNAIKDAFGDIDPESPTLIEDMKPCAQKLIDSLPGLMDAFTADDFVENLHGSMLASFLNGALPADFWRKTGAKK